MASAPATAKRITAAKRPRRLVRPAGSNRDRSARLPARRSRRSASARATRCSPICFPTRSSSRPLTRLVASRLQTRTAPPLGGTPPRRTSSRAIPSRPSCRASDVTSSSCGLRSSTTKPRGTTSAVSPPANSAPTGAPAAPSNPAIHSNTASVRASPPQARSAATRADASAVIVQLSTVVPSMTAPGSASLRCARAAAASAWPRVRTPPAAGGQPIPEGVAASSPLARSRFPGAVKRSGSMPSAWKRWRTASQGSGVRSRCQTR